MEFGRHCSLAGISSWTDLLTNVSAIRHTHLAEHVESLLTYGEAPQEMALDLLHEATHQWCFASPVGSALAYLHARVVHLAAAAHVGHTIPFREMYEDLIRLETTRELLRPVAEGLAMFLELDAKTGPDSNLVSMPFTVAHMLFLDPASLADADKSDATADAFTNELQRITRAARLTPQAIQRRVNLLSQPMSLTAGGYLPGYLAVKTLWLESARQAGNSLPLTESDLFASYVRAYFYRDYGLVDRLLDPSTSGRESVEAIADYLTGRLASFVSEVDVPHDLYAYELMANRTYEEFTVEGYYHDPLHYLHVDEHRYSRAVAAWMSIKEWMMTSEPHDSLDRVHQDMQRILNQSRHYLHLASASGTLDVDEQGAVRFSSDTGRLLWKAKADAEQPGSGPGRLEVFCSTYDPLARIVGVFRGSALVGTSLAGHDENPHVPLAKLIAEYDDVVGLRGFLADGTRYVEETVEQHGVAEIWEALRARILPRLVTRMYWGAALAHTNWDLNARMDEIAEEGLFLLPNVTRANLEGAALLGLAASARIPNDKLPALFDRQQCSLSETLAWLETSHLEIGFPLLLHGDAYYTNL